MVLIVFFAAIAFLGSIAWFVTAPGFEPAIAIVTSLSAFVATFIGFKKAKQKASQKQSVGTNSIGVQADGDIRIGSIQINQKASKDAE